MAQTGTAWSEIEKAARGQTVYFNAWAGSDRINAYIQWAAAELKAAPGVPAFGPHWLGALSLAAHLPDWHVTSAGTLVVEGAHVRTSCRAVGAGAAAADHANARHAMSPTLAWKMTALASAVALGARSRQA